MAHFINVIRARKLRRNWKLYLKEKQIGYNEEESDDESSEDSGSEEESDEWYSSKTENQNSVKSVEWKRLVGFIGGVLLTYILFIFLYIGVNFSLETTTLISGIVGVILCFSIAFSSKVRCYVLLLIPVFFSKEGREALLTYALFLSFTGPARNTMHNMRILSDSMTCGQEMVKRSLTQIFEMVKTPSRAMTETLEKLAKALKESIGSFRNSVMKIKRLIVCILSVIKKSTEWLRSIINLCNRKLGTPFQRCMKTFDEAITDCKAKMGVLDFLCHVVHIVKCLCYSAKFLDFMCLFTELFPDEIIQEVKKRLRKFNRRLKTLLYVEIEFCDAYELQSNITNTKKERSKPTIEKIADSVEKLQSIFSFCGFMFSLVFLFLILKVYSYKYKFLSSDQYDNVYINKYIIDLDMQRAKMDRETVLPLEPRERKKYGKPTAIRLLEIEKTRIAQSMSFMGSTSFKIFTFLVVDYCLFWVLLTIYRTGYDAMLEVEKSKLEIHVDGVGIMANFYRSLGNAFQVPKNPNMHLTPIHCFPDPCQPDTSRYIQIGFLVVLCWILTVMEGYGLRLRNVVMSHYYPDRARERAIWLYNHILCSRGSFLRYARRELRRKYCTQAQPPGRQSLLQRLFADFPLLNVFCGENQQAICLICGPMDNKSAGLKFCKTPDCEGQYCLECFSTLQNVCTICQNPVEYGDFSDISEEIDSSEEDYCNRKSYKNYTSTDSDCEKFLTFKDMEVRDRFRDMESNKFPDYAKLGDLYHNKKALKKRLTVVLRRQIQCAKKEKRQKTKIKQSIYKQIKFKVEHLISSIQRKKLREITLRKSVLRRKFAEKIDSLKYFKRKRNLELKCSPTERSKSRVSFKLNPLVNEATDFDYQILKEKIRARIKRLKENKSTERKASSCSLGRSNSSKTSIKGDNKSQPGCSNDSSKNNFMSYYFVESEKGIGFSTGEKTSFDRKSGSNDSFFENTQFKGNTDLL